MERVRHTGFGTAEAPYNADQGARQAPVWNWQTIINSLLQWTGIRTTPVPLRNFPGEFIMAPSSSINFDINTLVGQSCTGVSFVNVIGVVQYSINGGGFNTAPLGSMSIDNAWITSLYVQTGAGSSVNVQLRGV